jgi:hypothetical protein
MLRQRDVIIVYDRLPPDGKTQKHPFIVLSCQRAIEFQHSFIGIMMTSSENYDDAFSYYVTDEMFEKPLKEENCQLRLHIISHLMEHDLDETVKQPVNRMKKIDFDKLLDEIFNLTFSLD